MIRVVYSYRARNKTRNAILDESYAAAEMSIKGFTLQNNNSFH